jgi:excisionase family DNA binding protein
MQNTLKKLAGYLSIKEVAELLGVSTRNVYHYIKKGQLASIRIGQTVMVREEALEHFTPPAPGRKRTPPWHPTNRDGIFFTIVALFLPATIQEEQIQALENHLARIRAESRHLFPGSLVRYILYNQPDQRLEIQIGWQALNMPDDLARRTALAIFCMELTTIIPCEEATYHESLALLNT